MYRPSLAAHSSGARPSTLNGGFAASRPGRNIERFGCHVVWHIEQSFSFWSTMWTLWLNFSFVWSTQPSPCSSFGSLPAERGVVVGRERDDAFGTCACLPDAIALDRSSWHCVQWLSLTAASASRPRCST